MKEADWEAWRISIGKFLDRQASVVHPEYGPCDGFADGWCSVCEDTFIRLLPKPLAFVGPDPFRGELMKICITGGRDFGSALDEQGNLTSRAISERRQFQQVLDFWLAHFAGGGLELAHGGASGADELATEWAKERRVPVTVFPADWKGLGKVAGPVRNRQLLEAWRPDFVLAFAGGAGTRNCVQTAKLLRIPVLEVGA